MTRPRRNRRLVIALYLNAGLLLAIVIALVSRGNGPAFVSAAYGAPQTPPIAGGGGLFLMPAQLAVNKWGVYLMDIDSQTLCVYEYNPAGTQLRFVASRYYRFDRNLKRWNTAPDPEDVQHLVELEKNAVRGKPADDAPRLGPPAPSDSPPAPPGDGEAKN